MWLLIVRLTIFLFAFSWGVLLTNIFSPSLSVTVPTEVKAEPVAVPVVDTRTEPAPVVNTTPSPMIILDYPDKFSPDGSYVLLGKKPKQFSDFEYLYIETYIGKDGSWTGAAIVGSHAEQEYAYQSVVFLLATEKRLVLVTEPNALGIAYRFDGEFLRSGMVGNSGESKAVLKGRLTKSQNGRRIAESVVTFRIERHSC
jgi:hypothetical protein